MSDRIKVNTGRLRGDASEIQEHINAISKLMSDLREHSAALDGAWDGEGSEAFKAAFASDLTELETLISSLRSLGDYETNAREQYDDCEQKIADLVSQIKVG